MKRSLFITVLFLSLALAAPSQAIDFNLFNINVGSPEGQRLAGAYGSAYGYTPQQVAPAMLGPAEEVPTILRIAQAAGTVPMSVWMMRKMGFSYGSILSTFALGPSTLMGSPYGSSPYGYGGYGMPWNSFTDPFFVQVYRVNFLRNVLRVNPLVISQLPWGGIGFSRALVYPYHPVYGTWMPPGIAKKYGLWIPPGQRKKVGWWGDWGPSGGHPGHGKGHPGKGGKDKGGKSWGNNHPGKGGKDKGPSNTHVGHSGKSKGSPKVADAKGNGNGQGNSGSVTKSKGGSSKAKAGGPSNGGGKSKGGGGKGKGKGK